MQLTAKELSPGSVITGIQGEYIVNSIQCNGNKCTIQFTNGTEWVLLQDSWVSTKEGK